MSLQNFKVSTFDVVGACRRTRKGVDVTWGSADLVRARPVIAPPRGLGTRTCGIELAYAVEAGR